MVAGKLTRQWFAYVWKTICIRQLNRQLSSSSYNHNTLRSLRTSDSVKESLQMHFKVAVKNFYVTRWGNQRCYECFQCIVVVRWTGKLYLGLLYAITCQYQTKALITTCDCFFSLSATRVNTLWLNNQLVFAVHACSRYKEGEVGKLSSKSLCKPQNHTRRAHTILLCACEKRSQTLCPQSLAVNKLPVTTIEQFVLTMKLGISLQYYWFPAQLRVVWVTKFVSN